MVSAISGLTKIDNGSYDRKELLFQAWEQTNRFSERQTALAERFNVRKKQLAQELESQKAELSEGLRKFEHNAQKEFSDFQSGAQITINKLKRQIAQLEEEIDSEIEEAKVTQQDSQQLEQLLDLAIGFGAHGK